MLLPTTSTSFVATHPAWSTTINHLPRIVVLESGSATYQMQAVGVTRSKPGKRYHYSLTAR